ncbi:axoneme-associated protein mst101(2)-like isoform X2 [Acropora muricata]|uniref:axoneme-associated protein mst101(2)-like isoform X2 n=1 Tax=Acropora muricata TaxID=159855 RepID=UPI0034E546A4
MVAPRKRWKLIMLGRVMVLSVALNLQLLQQSLAQPRNRSVQLSVCIWRTCQEEEKTEGFSLENVEVDNRAVPDRDKDKEDDLDGSQKRMKVGVEPSATLAKKPWAAKKQRCAAELVDVTHLPDAKRDRDGFPLENVEVPERDKDKEDDLDGSRERMEVGVEPSVTLAKKPWAAKKQRCAAERVDVMHLPDAKKDRDGFPLENVEVPDRDKDKECDLHGSQKPRAARKQRCAAEGVDVTHLPDAKKDRDGFPLENVEVPDRDKDKEDDLDGSRERMEVGVEPSATLAKKPWAAKKKKVATEHVDVMHLPDAEKDRDGIPLENVEIDNRTVPDRDKDKECDLHGSQKPRAAKKQRCAAERVDVTHLPDAKKDRDGFPLENVEVPDRDKDKEDDLDGSRERMEVGVEPSATLAKNPRAAKKKKCATEHVDVTHSPDAEKDRDGIPLENVEIDNRTVPDRDKDKECDLHGSQVKIEVDVEPSATLAKKPRAAKEKKCATEHVDVTHSPDAEKDRDGIPLENGEIDNRTVPDRDKDRECDLHGSQEKIEVGVEPSATLAKPRAAKEKKCAIEHVDVTHSLDAEKDRDGIPLENVEIDNRTVPDRDKDNLECDLHGSQEKIEVGVEPSATLTKPASHPQPATTSSLPQSPLRRIYPHPNPALWVFAPEISQSKFEGRTSSNACTFIALLMGRSFSVTRNATVNMRNEPSSPQVWLSIVSTAIREGNRVHDEVTGGEAVNFSVEEAISDLNRDGRLGKTEPREYLNVEFTNEDSDRPQASLSYHLGRLSHEASNIAALVIVNEMTICFVARGEKLFVFDSHSHPPFGGAMVGVSDMSSRESFLATIKQILGLQHNLCSLSFVEYL